MPEVHSNEKASACLIFPLSLSIAIPAKKYMELLWKYDDVVIKNHNTFPTFFFFFFLNLEKTSMFPFWVILIFQIILLLWWVFLLMQEIHVPVFITLGHMKELPPCCFHAHKHPFKIPSDRGSKWNGFAKSLCCLCLQRREGGGSLPSHGMFSCAQMEQAK